MLTELVERWADDDTPHQMFLVRARWLLTGEEGLLAVAPRENQGPGIIINHLEDQGLDVQWLIPIPPLGSLPEDQMEELRDYLLEE